MRYCKSAAKCVKVELVAIAALNLFLQVNYTGPSLHHGGVARPGKEDPVKALNNVNPHRVFAFHLNVSQITGTDAMVKSETDQKGEKVDSKIQAAPINAPFHNAVFAELSVDGEWPCPVCKYPYFLLFARSILLTLADPNRPDWSQSFANDNTKAASNNQIILRKHSSNIIHFSSPSKEFVSNTLHLSNSQLWSARAAVAHIRLLQADEASSLNLWNEVKDMFEVCRTKFCDNEKCPSNRC